MPSQLSKGHTFSDGTSGNTAADLNNLVDAGTLLPGAITEQTQTPPSVNDYFIFVRTADGNLKKCSFQDIIDRFPTNATAGVASLRSLGTSATNAAPGNDSRFPARITGIRKGNNTSPDTAAVAGDFALPKNLNGGTTIDWTQGNCFYDSLVRYQAYTLTGGTVGQTVRVQIKRNGFDVGIATATLGSILTLGSGTTAIEYVFTATGNGITGVRFNL